MKLVEGASVIRLANEFVHNNSKNVVFTPFSVEFSLKNNINGLFAIESSMGLVYLNRSVEIDDANLLFELHVECKSKSKNF